MASTSKSTVSTSASGNQQMSPTTEIRKDIGHGFMYQTKLIMLFLHRGLRAEHVFKIATELTSAKKFDDLVYEYTVGESKIYRLLQAKHKLNNKGDEKIGATRLLTEIDGDYSLKYFFSYREMKEEKIFKGEKIQDVIVCTNIDFNYKDLVKNNITLERIKKFDDILSMSTDHNLSREPLLYRFGSETIPILMKNVENNKLSKLTRLAEQLVTCFLSCKKIRHYVEPFKPYHMILAKEVIDIQNNKFQSNFLAGCLLEDKNRPLEERTLKFRTIFKRVFEKETDSKIKFADINEAIDAGQELKFKKIGLSFSTGFGKTAAKKAEKNSSEDALPKEEGWLNNAISSEEIKDFFEHLVFAVNQPNEDELGDIIRREIGKGLNEEWTQNVYSKFEIKALRFSQGKEKEKWSPSSDWKKFFDDEKEKLQPIFFDIQDPVSLFTGRKEQLKNLHEMLLKSGSAAISQEVSISGLGGIGKSQLVRKYISLHKSDFDNRVIWLNAESHTKLSEAFRRLAVERLGISLNNSHDESPKDIESIVEEVYKYFSAAKSLFVFDNAEKNVGVDGIKKFLPCSSLPRKPYVLITSRNCRWGTIPVISLDALTNLEAMELIKEALKIENDEQNNEIRRLAETLQCFPLALQQALAYINVTDAQNKNIGKKFDIGDYLNRFEKETQKLLDFKFPDEGDDTYTKTTFTTWNITIEKIKDDPESGEVAVKMLNVMTFLGPDDIPTRMFFPMCDNEETIGSAVQLLKQFSIVSSGMDPTVMNIHRLVQLVTRLSLQNKDEEEGSLLTAWALSKIFVSTFTEDIQISFRRKFVAHLEITLSNLDALCVENTWAKTIELTFITSLLYTICNEYNVIGDYCRATVLHERQLKIFENHFGFENCVILKNIVGHFLLHKNDYTKAKDFLERILKIQESHDGSENVKVADTLCLLGSILTNSGDCTNAKELLKRALRIQKSHNGSEDIKVAKTLYLLESNRRKSCDYTKAKESIDQALRNKENLYGCEDFEVAETLCLFGSNLTKSVDYTKIKILVERALRIDVKGENPFLSFGLSLLNSGDYNIAKEFLERILRIQESHYGSEHVEVASTLCLLGITLTKSGDNAKAKKLLDRALRIQESHYGSEDIKVADTLCSLASNLTESGDYTKAKELLERALRIHESYHGSEHVQVANTLYLLGFTLPKLGDYAKAKKLLDRALRIQESHYGSEDVEVADTLWLLGSNLTESGDYTKAKELLERALRIKESYHGSEHVKVANTLYLLGLTLPKLGDYAKAKKLLDRALRIQESHYGSEDIKVADTLCSLASNLTESGDYTKAKELLERALRIQESHYGSEGIKVADTLCLLGLNLTYSGDFIKAKELLERALRIQESHYGSEDIKVADTLYLLGSNLTESGYYTKAKELLERALRIQESHHGSEHVQVANTLYVLGLTLPKLGDYAKAKKLLDRALRIQESHYGSEDVEVADTLWLLGSILKESGDYTKAKELLERALRIQESHYGSEDVKVVDTLCSLGSNLTESGDHTQAEELLERALGIQESHYGSEDVKVADTLFLLGSNRTISGDCKKAKELLERALRIQESHYGSEDINVADTLCLLGSNLTESAYFTKAKELLERALRIQDSHFGSEDVRVQNTLYLLGLNLTKLGDNTKAMELLERVLRRRLPNPAI